MKTVLSAALPRPAHPHKSTTHEELFFHIDNSATVFFRKEDGHWYASVALRDARDQFNRRKGRTISRRKYFTGKRAPCMTTTKPDYDLAYRVYDNAAWQRAYHLLKRL